MLVNPQVRMLVAVMAIGVAVPVWAGPKEEPKDQAPKVFIYNDHGKRDPFWRLVNAQGIVVNAERDPQSSSTTMVLEGIVYDDSGESVAMVNGNIVKVGDLVGMLVVKEITASSVVLQQGDVVTKLELPSVQPGE